MRTNRIISLFAALLTAFGSFVLPISVQAQAPRQDLVEVAQSNSDFSTLVAALQAAGLVDALRADGPFTVFAPNNAAFAKLPAETLNGLLADPAALKRVLLYHVVPGRQRSTDLRAGKVVTLQGAAATVGVTPGVTIDGASVIAADIEAANGVIHVIDTVILPPGGLVDIAVGNSDFSTLVTALQAAGLVDALRADGPFTVFAPNNAAFAKLPAETLNGLLADPAALKRVLLYHVVPGRQRSTDLRAGKVVTLQGAAATVGVTSGVTIDGASVIAADIEAANGVIHVIDTVILPPGGLVDIAVGNSDFSTLVTALQAAGLVDALRADGPFTVFAPNNAAFAKLPAETLNGLLADPAALKRVLLYHVVPGRQRSTDLRAGKVVTLQGAAATVGVTPGVTIDGASVIAADIEAANGVIHVIDTVILPPGDLVEIAVGNSDFSTLVTALQAAGLVDALRADGPFTVFAPNNAAFAKLPAETLNALLQDTNRLRHILLYHVNHGPRLRAANLKSGTVSTLHGAPLRAVVSGSGVVLNQSTVLSADVEARNGVIHVIDQVLLPADGFTDFRVSAIAKDGKVTIVWPVSNGGTTVLESSTSPSGPWRAVTAVPVISDGVNKVELEATAPREFYRVALAP